MYINMNPCIVQGEASESDGEDSPNYYYKADEVKDMGINSEGAVISGEAPESDEEGSRPKVPVRATASAQQHSSPQRTHCSTYDSLLHKKLREYNASLHTNILTTLKTTIQNSLNQLASSDQQLLKSQIRLQRASTAMRTLEVTSNQLADKLTISACSGDIPDIKIPTENQSA